MQNIVTELLVINVFLGNEQFKSHYKEEELRQGDDHKNFVHAFNAYAPAGTVTGQLVYVNYARYISLYFNSSILISCEIF